MKTNPSKPKSNGSRGSRKAPPTNAFAVGNPGGPGRPKDDPEFIEACREKTPKALATLERAMDDVENNPGPAVKAAEVMLNRAWGTAPTTVKIDATLKAEVKAAAPPVVMISLTEALARLEGLRVAGALEDGVARGGVEAKTSTE